MPKLDDDQIERMCGKKNSYFSLKLARTVKNSRERKGYKSGSLRIYRCPVCHGYHITHARSGHIDQ